MNHPTKPNFKTFLIGVLTKFSLVRSQIGVYRQTKGLAMGSPLSGLLANLYLNILEQKMVKKFIKDGIVISWVRYIDDILCI